MLSERHLMIRETVREFARATLEPGAAERDREAKFPAEALARAAELGLMGMLVPEEYGGAGAGSVSCSLAIMEIASADGGCSTIISVHNSLVCVPILKFGSARQKQEFLEPLASGRMLGAFCLTEPEAGSDAAAIRTSARRDGDHYVLNGTKQFITSGSTADLAILFAVTDPEAGRKGVSAFLIPTDLEGYRCGQIERTMGQRCSDHCQIILEDCRVPAENLLGEEGEGLKIALSTLAGGRLGVASQSVGMARSAYNCALAYAKQRETFGKPIIEHQAIGFRLARMATQIAAAELMVLRAAALRDEGRGALKEASMAKFFASEMAESVCNDAIQVLGGYGYLADFPVERIYRDVRVCKIYEGSSEIQQIVISREIAKEAEFCGLLS